MDIRLIEYFGVALKEASDLAPERVNGISNQYGYAIHPDCCNESVMKWLDTKSTNYNSTFYKNIEEVTSRDRLTLFIEQIISYAITYGRGEMFSMNDSDYSEVPEIRKYKVILPISKEELLEKCINILYSGIALKQDTMEALCEYVVDFDGSWDINKVANKEAQCYLIDLTDIMPADPFTVIRYINFKVTRATQIVKDEMLLHRYKYGSHFDMSILNEDTLKALSSIFYRYKPVFLGLGKQSASNKKVVNRLRRMAVKNHKPFTAGFWETIVSTPHSAKELKERLELDTPSNFKIIRLIQAVRENRAKIGASGNVYSMYNIRNGRVWYKKEGVQMALSPKYGWWDLLEEMLYNELVARLSKKACTIRLPEALNLVCPTSEKTFIGNIPFGSYYDMQNHNMIGIYWRNEWGAHDFDLSFTNYEGTKIGWDSSFYNMNRSIVYSGDMTNANPEASEVIYMANKCPDGMIKVNRYCGECGSKFKFCVAQSEVKSLPKNYMIDPNTIKFETMVESTDAESFVGFVVDGRLYMCDFKSGDRQVSHNVGVNDYVKALKRKALSFVDLRQLLVDAGFKIRKQERKDNPIQIDLSELDKGSLIELFS